MATMGLDQSYRFAFVRTANLLLLFRLSRTPVELMLGRSVTAHYNHNAPVHLHSHSNTLAHHYLRYISNKAQLLFLGR